MVFYAAFNSIEQYFSHITATAHIIHAFLGFTSSRLGSEVSCPRTLPRKNPDLVRLEPRTPGLRVKHFTTEPRGTRTKSIQAAFILMNRFLFFLRDIPVCIISPLPAKPNGTLGLHSVRLSVCPSVRPSVSLQYQFSGLFP